MDELQALTYFSSLNPVSRKIAQREKCFIKYLGNKWIEYSPECQEEILNDLCVPHSTREDMLPVADDDDGLPQCWPTLKLPSGEKIIVDENDIWTWRDEHSGPFSWKSKSQQDLTLLDLEPENLIRPLSKTQKTSEESDEPPEQTIRNPRQQFPLNHDSWTKVVLEDFMANCHEDAQTPVHTPTSPTSSHESTSEEVNPAFEGSVEDLTQKVYFDDVDTNSPNESSTDILTSDQELPTEVQASKGKSKGSKTPSPKKLPHSGLVKKDGKGARLAIDSSQQLLITHNKDEERTAFTNPVMEWSSFVGQSSTDPDDVDCVLDDDQKDLSKTECHPPTSVTEPTAMVIDRGQGCGVTAGEDSAESTPDHNTQLLKPVVAATVVEEAEKEEVVYVVDDGAGELSVSSKLVVTPPEEPDIIRSGFDFLDNW